MLKITEEINISALLQDDGSKISFEDYLIKYDSQHAKWLTKELNSECRSPISINI